MSEPFEVPEPTATLVFDEGVYVGVEVQVRLRLAPTWYYAIRDVMDRRVADDTTQAQMIDLTHEASAIFARLGLISWNVVDPLTHEPLPATVEGLDQLDIRTSGAFISTWMAWLGKAPFPLPVTPLEPTALPTELNRKQRRSTAGGRTAAGSRPKSTRSRTSSRSSESAA